MTKINKDFFDIPQILSLAPTKGTSRIKVFQNNIDTKKYIDDKHSYKVNSIQQKLNEIYHLKCAYCEKKLLDSPKHIEHYRPKSIYYWLAYSWDNLLLSCGFCNSVKGNRFEILNSQVKYNNEQFKDIHNLSSNYDDIEEPLIINPEKENIIKEIIYDKNALISSSNNRVQHTIENTCNLNRKELVELRSEVINNFKNKFNRHFNIFKKEGSLSRFEPDIEIFIQECNETEEFYSFRYFILRNVDIFFEDKSKQKIFINVLNKIIKR